MRFALHTVDSQTHILFHILAYFHFTTLFVPVRHIYSHILYNIVVNTHTQAESVSRLNQRALREPWCRVLWNCLWCGKLDSVKQCFEGMIDLGVVTHTSAKLFHCEVVFPPKRLPITSTAASTAVAPLRIAHLEPCGAPSSVKPCRVEGDNQYSLHFKGKPRRILIHGCMHALDVYLCMHELVQSTNNLVMEPPVPDTELLPWLQAHCTTDSEKGGGRGESDGDDFKLSIIHEAFNATVSLPLDDTQSSSSVELVSDEVLKTSLLLPSIGRHVQLEVPHLTGEKIEMPQDDCTLATNFDTDHRDSSPHRRLSYENNEPETTCVEERVGDRKSDRKGLWWRLREEALKDKARASELHFTKREPFKYKRMNKGKLM